MGVCIRISRSSKAAATYIAPNETCKQTKTKHLTSPAMAHATTAHYRYATSAQPNLHAACGGTSFHPSFPIHPSIPNSELIPLLPNMMFSFTFFFLAGQASQARGPPWAASAAAFFFLSFLFLRQLRMYICSQVLYYTYEGGGGRRRTCRLGASCCCHQVLTYKPHACNSIGLVAGGGGGGSADGTIEHVHTYIEKLATS